jgi:hypothetical protein
LDPTGAPGGDGEVQEPFLGVVEKMAGVLGGEFGASRERRDSEGSGEAEQEDDCESRYAHGDHLGGSERQESIQKGVRTGERRTTYF